MMQYELHCGNSKELLKTLEDNSIDSIVTDPPYELGFMGKKWDASGIAYDVELWRECLRVLKPGGHLLAFSGSRTYHRMTVAIEDAGFEIRDQIMWLYGSGFPKSHDVSKAIDKMAGARREVVGTWKPQGTARLVGGKNPDGIFTNPLNAELKGVLPITAPATEAAKEWNGWGTALKPAHEPICVARKPLIGTVAENVLTHGTGAINVDGCRVETNDNLGGGSMGVGSYTNWTVKQGARPQTSEWKGNTRQFEQPTGRWPANIIHDGSAEVLAGFPNDEKQSPARFFYCAKASKKDRDEGLEGFEGRFTPTMGNGIGAKEHDPETATPKRNHHPTVKPTELMRYLCRLVTPPNGVILDPFLGSGSTAKAAIYEGFRFIGFDLNQEYIDIAKARIEYAIKMNNESSGKKENTLFEDEE
jgi:DNA modification methylase